MGKEVASLYATLGLKTDDFNRNLNNSKTGLSRLSSGFQQLTGFSLSSAAAIGIMSKGLQSVYKFLVDSHQASVEAARADAKLEAVLTSTGGAAGVLKSELTGLATTLSKQAGIDDELVSSAEAVLLTFTKIGRNAFPTAMQAAVDMSAVLGGDLQSSVMQIGKAMNDFSGYTMLKRAGVSFTAEQIKQIDNFRQANDLISYQNLILKELATEFGGAAKKMQEAGDGSENMKIAWENLQESVGNTTSWRGLNLVLTDVLDWMTQNQTAVNQYNKALKELADHEKGGIAYTKEGIKITSKMVDEYINAGNATKAWSDRLTAQAAAYRALNPEIEKYTGGLEDIAEAAVPVSAYLNDLTTELLFNQAAAGLDAEAALNLAETMGLVPLQTGNALDTLQELRDKLATGQITIEQYTAAIQRMNDTINGIPSGSFSFTPGYKINEETRAVGGAGFGWTVVGEQGPEMVKLPAGSQVFNNAASKNMKPGGNQMNFYGDNYITVQNDMAGDIMQELRL